MPYPDLSSAVFDFACFAPGGYIAQSDIQKSKKYFENNGIRLFVHPQSEARLGETQIAGTAAARAHAFHELMEDTAVRAVIAAGGGNRVMEMLAYIDFAALAGSRKPVIGFSDVTALLLALHRHGAGRPVHGPVLKKLADRRDDAELTRLRDIIAGAADLAFPPETARTWVPGEAGGVLVGGNAALIDAMYGTGHMPDLTGALLFIEDTGMETSHLDRMLLSWRERGITGNLAGLIFGSFTHAGDTGRPFGYDVLQVISYHTADLGIPVVIDAPFGHGGLNLALPVGVRAKLAATPESVSLELLEP